MQSRGMNIYPMSASLSQEVSVFMIVSSLNEGTRCVIISLKPSLMVCDKVYLASM
jgi:hypothetical protein